MNDISLFLTDEAATEAVGATLAPLLKGGDVIYLHGDLGAGKTTLTRGLLHAGGHRGACKSPTYTLVEPYVLAMPVFHFDLYRIQSADELDYLALDDYFSQDGVALVEWPDKGQPLLPPPTLSILLQREREGRRATFQAGASERARELLDFLSKSIL